MEDSEFDEEDNQINEDMKNFNELGLIRDSLGINENQNNPPEKLYPNNNNNKNKNFFNKTIDIPNKIKENLDNKSQEDTDENNDADPENFKEFNKTEYDNNLDDVLTLHIFGRNTSEDKYIPLSKNAKFFERILHPIQYGSLRGSIFGLSSMCLGAGSMLLAKRCQQFGLVNFLVLLILGGLMAYWCLVMMIKAGKMLKKKIILKW